MEEWKLTKIGSLCKRVCSGGTPKSTVEEYYGGGIPWLNTKEVNFNRIYSTESTISESGLNNSSAKWIDEHSVIVAMYGATAAKCAIGMIPMTTNQACCNLMIDEAIADYRFVYYALTNVYSTLASLANGGAQQNLNAQLIKDFEILLPDLQTQHQIADILSTIDDKIENNNRINHNLEEQIQERFDSMIVSDNGLGYCQIADYVDVNPKRSLRKNEPAKCVDMSYLSTTGPFPSGWETKGYNGGMKFFNGDTIMARITPCLENGKVAYVNFLDDGETAFGSTEFIVLHAKEGVDPVFTYFLVRNKNFVDYATKNMNGSSGRQRVSGDTIGKFMIPVIDSDSLNEFSGFATPAMDVIRNNSFESRSLAATRDALLPLLLSGELSISQMNC